MNQIDIRFDQVIGEVKPLHGVCCAPYARGMGDNQRHSERELDRDTDMRIYLPQRIRNRRGDHGRNKQLEPEEKAIVLRVILHDYDRTLSPGEKEVLKELIEDLDGESESPEENPDGILKGLDEAVGRFDKLTRLWRGEK